MGCGFKKALKGIAKKLAGRMSEENIDAASHCKLPETRKGLHNAMGKRLSMTTVKVGKNRPGTDHGKTDQRLASKSQND